MHEMLIVVDIVTTGMILCVGEIELSDVNAPIIKLAEDGLKVWHLVKPDDGGHHMRDRTTNNNNNNNNKVISEIFLTRLLTTKVSTRALDSIALMDIYTISPAVMLLLPQSYRGLLLSATHSNVAYCR